MIRTPYFGDERKRRDSGAAERMPRVILQTNSLSTGTSMSSAPVAFLSMQEQQQQQQSRTLRILKRPSNNTPAASHQTAAPVLSMKEREAAYAAARDRIFNPPSSSLSMPTSSSSPDATPVVTAPSSSMTPAPAHIAGRGSGSSSNDAANTSNQGNTSMGCISRDPIGSTGYGT